MKKFENRRCLSLLAVGLAFFLLLLPVDFVWSPTFFVLKAAVNAVSVLAYAAVVAALWDRGTEPVEHGGLLLVLGLVTLPHLLLLPVFYYNSLVCTAVSAGLSAALLADWVWARKKGIIRICVRRTFLRRLTA